MATFRSWYDKFPEANRFLLLWGRSQPLMDFVIEREVNYYRQFNFIVNFVDESSDVDAYLLQKTLTTRRRLLVVRNFDSIKNKMGLVKFIKSSDHFIIARSLEKKPDFKMHSMVELLKLGKQVRCTEMADMEDFITDNLTCFGEAASVLISACNGNMLTLLKEIEKLQFLDTTITPEIIREYCCTTNWSKFFDDLFVHDKKSLLEYYNSSSLDIKKCLVFIRNKLRLLCFLLPYKGKRVVYRELAAQYGVSQFLIREYLLGIVKQVTFVKIKRWVNLLADIENKMNSGVTDGLLERLILLW